MAREYDNILEKLQKQQHGALDEAIEQYTPYVSVIPNDGVSYFETSELPEIISSLTTDHAEDLALPSKEDILIKYPNIDTKILDVVFAKQPNGNVWRLLSVRHDDKRKFSEDDWKAILEAIELGLVEWED